MARELGIEHTMFWREAINKERLAYHQWQKEYGEYTSKNWDWFAPKTSLPERPATVATPYRYPGPGSYSHIPHTELQECLHPERYLSPDRYKEEPSKSSGYYFPCRFMPRTYETLGVRPYTGLKDYKPIRALRDPLHRSWCCGQRPVPSRVPLCYY